MKKDAQIKKWIRAWEKANSSLTLIKIEQLKNKNYYLNNREILNSMLQYAFNNHVVRLNSGLVTQQNIFKLYYSQKLSMPHEFGR